MTQETIKDKIMKKPENLLYAAWWLAFFGYFAYMVLSWDLIPKEGERVHIIQLLLWGIAQTIGTWTTAIIIILMGLGVATATIFIPERKSK